MTWSWALVLWPLSHLAARAAAAMPGAPRWSLAIAAVLVAWAASAFAGRLLAWAMRIVLIGAGFGVAYFILRAA